MENNKKILQVKNLKVIYKSLLENVEAVAGIDIDLYAGEALFGELRLQRKGAGLRRSHDLRRLP